MEPRQAAGAWQGLKFQHRVGTGDVQKKTGRLAEAGVRDIQGTAVHTCNLSTQGVGAGGSGVQGHPWLHKELKTIGDM